MKIKINQLEGLITNIDTADLKPEAVIDLKNVEIWNGYAKAAFPKIQNSLNYPVMEGYTCETGIFAKISSDPFSKSIITKEYDILFLVMKFNNTRRFYYREMDKEEWQLLPQIDQSTIDGEVSFINQNGILRIYTPAGSYWFGYLDRQVNTPSGLRTFTGLSLENLVETKDLSSTSGLTLGGLSETGVSLTIKTNKDLPIGDRPSVRFRYLRTEIHGTTIAPTHLLVCNLYYTSGPNAGSLVKNPITDLYPTEDVLAGTDYFGYNGSEWRFWLQAGTVDYLAPQAILDYLQVQPNPNYGFVPGTPVINRPSIGGSITLDGNYVPLFSGVGGAKSILPPSTFVPISQFTYNRTDIDSSGFTATKEVDFITTFVLDDTSETIVDYQVLPTTSIITEKFGVALKLTLSPNVNKRLTRVRVYALRDSIDTDFQLAQEYNLLDTNTINFNDILIGAGTLTENGVTLSSNIAFSIDRKELSRYKVIKSFRAFTIKDGIGIGLQYGDIGDVYYSVIGGGNLQPDVVYTANILPIGFKDRLIAVTSINNNLAVIGTNSVHILRVDNTSNALIFSEQDTIEYGIDSIKQIAEVQGGVILFTGLGIYMTNGYDKQWISANINQDVKSLFSDSFITYNPYAQEFYLWNRSSSSVYRYSFERKNWEIIDFRDVKIQELLVDLDGNINILASQNYIVKFNPDATTIINNTTGNITLARTTLGEPSFDKRVKYIDIDYSGEDSTDLQILTNDEELIKFSLPKQSRQQRRIFIPLSKRIPKETIQFIFDIHDPNFVFYNMELDLDVEPRRYV